MQTHLEGRTVLVTGGSGAIGRATAVAYAREGARVAITYRQDKAAAAATCDAVEATGARAASFAHDLSRRDRTGALIDEVATALGPVAVVVANAMQWPDPKADEVPGLAESLDVNAVGTLALVDAALPTLREDGAGRIVLMSTDIVDQPMPGPVSYAAAKGALEIACRVLAVREAQHGVLTNTVRPGFTLTERARTSPWLGQPVIDAESNQTPTRRVCTPEDVAGVTVFLGSGANTHVNGQVVSVAGGRELTR